MVKNSKKLKRKKKVLPKDGIFQISKYQSLLSIGQPVCCEILSIVYT